MLENIPVTQGETGVEIGGDVQLPPIPASKSICKINGLVKSFKNTGRVLDQTNLTLVDNEAVALIGSNGAGKSTLLRCLLRLIEPEAGSIQLLGENVTALNKSKLRKLRSRVGFVFQKHNLVPRISVLSNVIHGAQSKHSGPRYWYQGVSSRAVREEAMACLDRVGLSHLASRRADQLSGGQSQRVAIARTLLQKPEIVLADEPVASLDPVAGIEVMDLFTELMTEEQVTLVFSSHLLDHATQYSNRVIGMKGGKIILDSPAKSINSDEIDNIYLVN